MTHRLRLLFYFLLFTFSFSFLSAQDNAHLIRLNKKIDSLLHILKKQKDDTAKANTLNGLAARLCAKSKYDTALICARSSRDLSEKIGYKIGASEAYNTIAAIYYYLDDFNKVLENDSIALVIDREVGYKAGTASTLGNMGLIYYVRGNYPKALDYFNQTLDIYKETGDKNGEARNLTHIGLIYWNQSNYARALDNMNKALALDEEIGNKDGAGMILSNIGIIYNNEGDYPRALENYFKAMSIYEQLGDKEGIATDLGNIGIIYKKQDNYSKALECYFKAVSLDEEVKSNKGLAANYGNIAIIYGDEANAAHLHHQPAVSDSLYKKALLYNFKAQVIGEKLGDKKGLANYYGNISVIYRSQGNFAGALEFANKALKIHRELGIKSGIANNLTCLGIIYMQQAKYKQARIEMDSAIMIAKSIGEKEMAKDAYAALAVVDSAMGDYKASLEIYKEFITYSDSLINEANTKKTVQTEMNFEFEQKQASEKAEQDKKDAVALQERNKQKVIRNSFIGGFALMLALAFFIFRGYRQKQKANEIISHQKTIVEEKQKEILDSIHYAQRIQKALLASDVMLSKHLPEYFVLYKPKDIVSGDFYWATKKGEAFYLAVCDSTGHGVPGAFMSLLNISFLNEAITEKGITQPSEVFNHARKRLIENISQDGGQDGMDGLLASLNPSEGGTILTYAAAYNTPVVIRNRQIIELPADKMPVGASPMEKISFTHQTFNLQKGDILYLFTDGYADQFGGPKGKKFKYAQLQQKLLAISHQPLAEQKKELEMEFDKWKGMLEQVDDVLVIGIRV